MEGKSMEQPHQKPLWAIFNLKPLSGSSSSPCPAWH